ncbi:tyrosine-type recombinase/integrase [Acidipropionibacterium jensenii]|uniref:Site-specific tyrosine recombinase XerC n=1 Tax=Acidipropionibacterium jensenii TaxID=1749 RepID=A0A3S4UX10_9ACTN|nr:site-specific integrase [Acidipropionibacterium jensenii]MDN5978438.1 site-specific integrase [Acidipropionibacterium jensenii]MDN5997532.1 site-specific integrase [Acidipropionibacterium jensenii]MDN6427920.1 site-specific integrase [Acidipropionibacterium jensenii]MDN6442623.1 site-specific integrase [Acidipropionibacterium jensenii]MDN6481441.1 site-specific integrase [Acidipropionibacterium jensenii]
MTSPESRESEAEEHRTTVAEGAEQWLQHLRDIGRHDGTLRTYRSKLKVSILPVLGDRFISDVQRGDIRSWWIELCAGTNPPNLKKGKITKRTNGQTRGAYMVAQTMWRWFVEQEWCSVSPVHLPGAAVYQPSKKMAAKDRVKVATPAQVRDLAYAMPTDLQVAVWLAAWCQLRQGEMLGLKRGDIDLKAATIHVSRSIERPEGGGLKEGPTKSEAGDRVVSIPESILPILRDHLAVHTGPGKRALVIHDDEGDWVHPTAFGKIWTKAAADAGLPGFRYHDLRHTGLTIFAQQGATLAELMNRGGHSDVQVALRYQHASLERDQELTAKLDERVVV